MLQKLKPRILVIDDDPSIGAFLVRVFEKTGRYSIEVQTDPIAAVATARGFRPDLLFVDINMPGLNGLEVAMQLREEPWLRDRPIVFFTGMATREMPPALAESSAVTEYLAKGTSPNEIVATADRLVGAI